MPLSISAINRLGERFRQGIETDDDLRLLEEVRQSYAAMGDSVIARLQAVLEYPISRRQGKTTQTIRAKLIRQRTRLSRMQDIDGCRLTVKDLAEQDRVAAVICSQFPHAEINDLREVGRFGYRAVHIIVVGQHPFEIQIRTERQNRWAQLSEHLAGRFGLDLKYGGGDPALRGALTQLSELLYRFDKWLVDAGPVKEPENQQGFESIDAALSSTLQRISRIINDLTAAGDTDNPTGE